MNISKIWTKSTFLNIKETLRNFNVIYKIYAREAILK